MFSLRRPQGGQQLMQWAESVRTLRIRVLQPVQKAAVQSEYGLSMCAVAGLKPRHAKEGSQHLRPFGHGDTLQVTQCVSVSSI